MRIGFGAVPTRTRSVQAVRPMPTCASTSAKVKKRSAGAEWLPGDIGSRVAITLPSLRHGPPGLGRITSRSSGGEAMDFAGCEIAILNRGFGISFPETEQYQRKECYAYFPAGRPLGAMSGRITAATRLAAVSLKS